MFLRKGNVKVVLVMSVAVLFVIYAIGMSLYNIGSNIEYEDKKAQSVFMVMSIGDIAEAEIIDSIDGLRISEEQYNGTIAILTEEMRAKTTNKIRSLTGFNPIDIVLEDAIASSGTVTVTVTNDVVGTYKLEISGIQTSYDNLTSTGIVEVGSYYVDDWFVNN